MLAVGISQRTEEDSIDALAETVLSESIVGRARKAGHLDIKCWQIRDYTVDKHRNVDDTPYGPGKGMLLQADPIYRTWEAVCAERASRPHVIYLSPQGKTLTQQRAKQLSQAEHLFVLCGHYEGVDQRVLDEIVDEEISIGDYVLTGGELGALVLIDCVARLCPGVLADESCFTEESHWNGLLEYPQYTRPRVYEGLAVPDVLLEGNHALIEDWRYEQALRITLARRPEMLKGLTMTRRQQKIYERVMDEEKHRSGALGDR